MRLRQRRPSWVNVDVIVEKRIWLVEDTFRVVDQLLVDELIRLEFEATFNEFGNGDQKEFQIEFEVFSGIQVQQWSRNI